jgi:hypothetical protein
MDVLNKHMNDGGQNETNQARCAMREYTKARIRKSSGKWEKKPNEVRDKVI